MAVHNEVRVMPQASGRGASLFGRITADVVQRILLTTGALLLPLGLIVICLGWYGAANTPYEYDQTVYLLSGGALGLGLTFVGGFLYFGSWLARLSVEQRASQQRMEEALTLLVQAVAKPAAAAQPTDRHDVLVIVGSGTTIHRADCDLIAGRDDLHPVGGDTAGLTGCRICRPEAGLI